MKKYNNILRYFVAETLSKTVMPVLMVHIQIYMKYRHIFVENLYVNLVVSKRIKTPHINFQSLLYCLNYKSRIFLRWGKFTNAS